MPPAAAPASPARPAGSRRGFRTAALASAAFAATMFGAAYAAVPLYDWFCRVTGFGGTPQIAEAAPNRIIDHWVTVRLDSNVSRELPWRFDADTVSVRLRAGETSTVHYRVTNTSDRPTTGIATFNVTPQQTGAYFNKIQCFCFTDQTLQPGETRDMPVLFFIDPAIVENDGTRTINTITLSYTFFVSRDAAPATKPVATTEPAAPAARL